MVTSTLPWETEIALVLLSLFLWTRSIDSPRIDSNWKRLKAALRKYYTGFRSDWMASTNVNRPVVELSPSVLSDSSWLSRRSKVLLWGGKKTMLKIMKNAAIEEREIFCWQSQRSGSRRENAIMGRHVSLLVDYFPVCKLQFFERFLTKYEESRIWQGLMKISDQIRAKLIRAETVNQLETNLSCTKWKDAIEISPKSSKLPSANCRRSTISKSDG